jgi:selenium metabolism protein YedF
MADIIVINGNVMGSGDDDLGAKLMGSFLRKIWGQDRKPGKIIFYNSGVLLLAEGSEVLDALTGLAESGVDLIACGTCCTHFDIGHKLAIGRVSDMGEIAGLITGNERAVTI